MINGAGFGIKKEGTGTLAYGGTNNSYGIGTTLNSGTLNINSTTALGTGSLIINGGTIDNTSGSTKILANNNAQFWNSDIIFTGSNSLSFGSGAVTISGDRTATVAANNLTVGAIDGGGSLIKAGPGALTITGASTYSGPNTNINGGTLALSGGNDRLPTGTTVNFTGTSGTLHIGSTSQTIGVMPTKSN